MGTISQLDNNDCSFLAIVHRKKTEGYINPQCMFSVLRLAVVALRCTSQQNDNNY